MAHLRTLPRLVLALGIGALLTAADKPTDYVLIGVTDKQAIFADRASIKKSGNEAVGKMMAVFVPESQGIRFVESQTEFQCNSMLAKSSRGKAFHDGDKKGDYFPVDTSLRSIDKASPLFTFREMACQGRAPGDLPRAASRQGAVRLAMTQVAELKRGR
jgi:hypothetical protein